MKRIWIYGAVSSILSMPAAVHAAHCDPVAWWSAASSAAGVADDIVGNNHGQMLNGVTMGQRPL